MNKSEQVTNLIKGEDQRENIESPKIELTAKEVRKKLSRLGNINELAKKVESPFTSNIIESLARLVIKLERDLPSYDTILSDDTGGRLPSLFLRKIIDRVRSKNKLELVKTYFLATGRHGLIKKDEAVKNFLASKKKEIGKALVVTEYIESGDSIVKIMKLLEELGINFDVACVSAKYGEEGYIYKLEQAGIFKRIRYGKTTTISKTGMEFYDRKWIDGVKKAIGSLSPHPEVASLYDRDELIQARKDINFLVDEFINKLLD